MKLEDQVTNLELSKKLKELGVEQESILYWVQSQINNKWVIERVELVKLEIFGNSATSAFTVAELGEILPEVLGEFGKDLAGLEISKYKSQWAVWYQSAKTRNSIFGPTLKFYDNFANALAKMLIYLIETKFLTLKDIKKKQ